MFGLELSTHFMIVRSEKSVQLPSSAFHLVFPPKINNSIHYTGVYPNMISLPELNNNKKHQEITTQPWDLILLFIIHY